MENFFDTSFLGMDDVERDDAAKDSTFSLDQLLRGETPAPSPRREQPRDESAKERRREKLATWRESVKQTLDADDSQLAQIDQTIVHLVENGFAA